MNTRHEKKPLTKVSGFCSFCFQQFGISLAVLDAAGNPAEGGRRNVCLGHDLIIGIALNQQLGCVAALGHVLDSSVTAIRAS